MKKVLLYLPILLLFVTTLNAQTGKLLYSEDYTGFTAGALTGQNGYLNVSTLSLNVNNVTPLTNAGYVNGGGNYVEFTANSATNGRVWKPFTDSISILTPGNVIYVSFLLKVNSTFAASTAYFFSLGESATSNYYAKLFCQQVTATTFNLGFSKTSNTAIYTATPLNNGETYLVVMRYDINNTAINQFGNVGHLWINPSLSAEPDTNVADIKVPAGGGDFTATYLSAILFHNRGTLTPLYSFDGVRVAAGSNSADAWTSLAPALATPVEMTSFTASVGNGVKLSWSTATETNNKGFEVERKSVNSNWTKVGFVQGKGTTTSAQNYTFTDKANNGSYQYRLRQVDFDGTSAYSKTVSVEVNNTVSSYSLDQNYPNPFNPSTTISFATAKAGNVTLKVYNLIGQEVRTLVNGMMEAGNHTVNFNAAGLNSGMYFYKLETESFSQVRKMTLLK